MLINLTPHAINIIAPDGAVTLTVAPSGTVARCKATTVAVGTFDGVPITETTFGEVTGLPEPQDGVCFITSSLVATAVRRPDVLMPNESVRDENGRIVGCRSLARV